MIAHLNRKSYSVALVFAASAALIAATSTAAVAANLCVDPKGPPGCYKTIGAAVAVASPGDVIYVAAGVYKEDVVIGKSLSLIGAGETTTTIYAAGLANGVYIDGRDHSGLNNVVVTGFTVENAQYEGILVTNASSVTIWGNHVRKNDLSLSIATTACVGQPDWETDEGFDCGEGIHLTGANHSTVANNIVESNAGGILLSDDTGATYGNVVSGNLATDNPYDCGIVLASHPPGPNSTARHNGVFQNTIIGNTSTRNGFQVPGAGAGVGIFADGTGVGTVSNNVISYNILTNNGLPGVAFHSHVGPGSGAPADNLNGNVIVGNQISGNGADLFDTATPGPTGININAGFGGTPIVGTVISENKIWNEAQDVAVNTPGHVDLHLNNLLGSGMGVDNLGKGTINANENYWGCAGGPSVTGCSTVSGTGVTWPAWLTSPFVPNGIMTIPVP